MLKNENTIKIENIKSKNECKNFMLEILNKKSRSSLRSTIGNSEKLKNLILKYTSKFKEEIPYIGRAFIIMFNLKPYCKKCGKITSWNRNKGEFATWCSIKCMVNDKEYIIKKEQTIFKLYGVKNTFQAEKCKEKGKQTCLKKYGVEFTSQSQQKKDNSEKTCLEKYGVKTYSQTKEFSKMLQEIWENRSKEEKEKIYNKAKQTFFKNLGVENPMQNIDIFEKQQKSSYYRKNYILPSKKEITLQGYENYTLNSLLKIYKEEEIIIKDKEIFKLTGPITYLQNNIIHYYRPDFFIPKDNLIIETKSTRTFNIEKEKCILKKDACINLGYNYRWYIYEKNGKEILVENF